MYTINQTPTLARDIEADLKVMLTDILRQDCSNISRQTKLLDTLGLTSLSMVTLLLSVEQQYNIIVRNADVVGLVCLGDLADLILQRSGLQTIDLATQ